MNPQNILTPDEKTRFWQVYDTINQYIPWLKNAVDHEMPFNDHLQKAYEQLDVMNRFIAMMELVKP